MSWIVVDVEANGPCPDLYSMISFGAVLLTPELNQTFYGQTLPTSDNYVLDAYKKVGVSYEEHKKPPHCEPFSVMFDFARWLNKVSPKQRPVLISDNPAFDWQWINYYFYYYINRNPMGHSARRIGDLYCGLVKDIRKNREWKKKFRKTKHTHNPVDDAMGNAEALLAMKNMGLNIPIG